jgi:predicted heme/steroid binding protein
MKEKMTKNKLTKIIFFAIVVFVIVFVGVYFMRGSATPNLNNQSVADLPVYTTDNLAYYDGTDSSKPIYIGLNGYVYDVTPGKEFYVSGASYHYLAGKDSSKDLNMIGGDIIVRKYKVIGKLAQ